MCHDTNFVVDSYVMFFFFFFHFYHRTWSNLSTICRINKLIINYLIN